MSNVIKPVYFNMDRTNKKVIDTDRRLKELPEFSEKKDLSDFEFVPGINVINVDDIIEEQKNDMKESASKMLAEARDEADGIIEQARSEADGIRRAAHEEGYKNGYNEGLASASGEIEVMKRDLDDKKAAMQQEYDNLIHEVEPQFAAIVGELVEKITGVIIEDTGVLYYLVDRALKNLPVSDTYYVHVCPEDHAALAVYRGQLMAGLPNGSVFDIVEDATLTRNKCVVETSTHMIDCSLDRQLNNLKQELRLLSIS